MNTVKIGQQEWAAEDLKVTEFRNGENIPLVTDNAQWKSIKTAAYCISPNGHYLYNWLAVNDQRGLAPKGFHVPTDEEWTELVEYLGGVRVAGEKMKIKYWDGTNSSGFSAVPGGYRSYIDEIFYDFGSDGHWWSSSPFGSDAWSRNLSSGSSSVYRFYDYVQDGFAVRCIKNK